MGRYAPLLLVAGLVGSCSGSPAQGPFFGVSSSEGYDNHMFDDANLTDTGSFSEDDVPRISLNDLVQAGRWHVDEQQRSVFESGERGLPLQVTDLDYSDCQSNDTYIVCKGQIGNNSVIGFERLTQGGALFYIANSQTDITLFSFSDPETPGLIGYLYDSFTPDGNGITRWRVTDLEKMFSHYDEGGIDAVWSNVNNSGAKIHVTSSDELDSLAESVAPQDGYVLRECSFSLIPKSEIFVTTGCVVPEDLTVGFSDGDVYLGGTGSSITIGGQPIEDISATQFPIYLGSVLRSYLD